MATIDPNAADPRFIWDDGPEPDVPWGEYGIDALIWPKPYVLPTDSISLPECSAHPLNSIKGDS